MPHPIISLSDISMRHGRKRVLDDVNLAINEGDFVAITGPNGGGKTTLLRIILRLLRPSMGTVTYYAGNSVVTDRLSIGYLPQKNMIDSRFPISVHDVVASGLLAARNVAPSERENRVAEMIELVGLTDHAGSSIGNLSGGQLQRALFARAIISQPSVLVLDEPLSYLDKEFERRIYEIVADLSKSTTIIIVSHEMSIISGMANRHLIVDHTLAECSARHHSVHYDCDD